MATCPLKVFIPWRRQTALMELEKLHRAVMVLFGLIVFHLDTEMRGIATMNHTSASDHWPENCHVLDWLLWWWCQIQDGSVRSAEQEETFWLNVPVYVMIYLHWDGKKKGGDLNLLHWRGGNLIILQRGEKGQKVTGYCRVFLAVSLRHETAAIKCSTDKVSTQLGRK